MRPHFVGLSADVVRHDACTTQALDDAARRITRYLLMQLTVNAIYGVAIAVGRLFIGLPNALLWSVLATFLRFLPYVGAWIAAAIPLALSLAVFGGWTRPVLVLGLFLLNELVSNNVLEPWLYGASTGISNIGILVSAVFWTWLWGPVGLIMATPLTVCVTVIGRWQSPDGHLRRPPRPGPRHLSLVLPAAVISAAPSPSPSFPTTCPAPPA